MTRTVAEMLREVTATLMEAGIDSAARDARALVALATERDVSRLTLEAHAPVGEDAGQRLSQLVAARAARTPLSHLTQRRAFWQHDFTVTPDVLDPRPETEILVEAALAGPLSRVLDLGTGSGAILLSLLAARPQATGVGVDLSPAALTVAAGNAAKLGVRDRVAWRRSNWFDAVDGSFDLIVSNPPYIALEEMSDLAPELRHEPRMALTDEGDGLGAYRAIAAGVGPHLATGGHLFLEIGPSQAGAVSALLQGAGLRDLRVLKDLDGRDRVVAARAP